MDDDRRTVMCDQKSHYILGKESTVKVVHLGVMAGGAIWCYAWQIVYLDQWIMSSV